MANDFDVIFESDPRNIRYWQAKLDYARGQVRILSTTPDKPPRYDAHLKIQSGRWSEETRRANVYTFQNFRRCQVRDHTLRKRRLKMWLTTKIPYYEARIEALRKPAWERLVGPDPW